MGDYDTRLFVHNLSFDSTADDVTRHFQDEGICPNPRVHWFLNPRTGKPAGACMVYLDNADQVQQSEKLDNNQFMGRKMYINKDTDNHHVQRFCKKFGLDFKVGADGVPQLIERGGADGQMGDSGGRDSNRRGDGRRLLLSNLPFDVFFGDIKDYLKNEVDCDAAVFVEMLKNPGDGQKGTGIAIIEVATDDDVGKVMSRDGQEVTFSDKPTRKLFVNQDNDNRRLKQLCEKNDWDYDLNGNRGRPRLLRRGTPGGIIGGGRGGAPPSGSYGGHPGGAPYGQPSSGQDYKGRPLVESIPDLLASTVFVANLSFRTTERDLMRHLENVGRVQHMNMMKYSEDYEDADKAGKSKGMAIVEFARARDASRAMTMYAGRDFMGRDINVRPAKELRPLPNGLSELGRPMPEGMCMDMCRRELQVDPHQSCTLFVHNIGFEVKEDEIRDCFELLGDVTRCALLTKKEDGVSRGICVVKLASGLDAQQCMNVLHDSKLHGRPLRLRLDRDEQRKAPPPPQPSAYGAPYGAPPAPYGAPPAHYGAPPPHYGAPPPAHDPYRQAPPPRDDYNRPPPPRFEDRGRDSYRAPEPARAPAPAPSGDKDSQISQLAALLGVNSDTLQAIRLLQGAKDAAPAAPAPAAQSNTPWKRESTNNYNGNSGRDRSPVRQNSRGPSQPPQQNQAAAGGKNWNPVTQDTIYLRNLPSTMTESRLRFMVSQCGNISFIDFPMTRENTPVGYAYIRFDGMGATDAAKQAIQHYDSYSVDGQRLECGLY